MGATHTRRAATSEDDVLGVFARAGLRAQRWASGPGAVYAAHHHTYHKVLYCLNGSITFEVSGSQQAIELRPFDRLDIPPQTTHSAVVGAAGCVCVEAAGVARP